MYKENILSRFDNFPFNGSVINYKELILCILIVIVLIYFGIVSLFHDTKILLNSVEDTVERQKIQASDCKINSLNQISAQTQVCKFIKNFDEITYNNHESISVNIFHDKFLRLLSETFPHISINISHQFLFLIYKKILISNIEGLNVLYFQEFSKVLLYKLNIPEYTLFKCYSKIIELDDSIILKEQKNFFICEINRLKMMMDRKRAIALRNIKQNLLKVVEGMKTAIKLIILL